MMAINTIATHPRDASVGIFCNSVALVWPLWLDGRCQASNVEVVAGDLFANNPLSPFSNIRAITPCARVRGGDRRRPFALNFCRGSRRGSGFVQFGFYEVALTTRPPIRDWVLH